jgi:hypothetical protein
MAYKTRLNVKIEGIYVRQNIKGIMIRTLWWPAAEKIEIESVNVFFFPSIFLFDYPLCPSVAVPIYVTTAARINKFDGQSVDTKARSNGLAQLNY